MGEMMEEKQHLIFVSALVRYPAGHGYIAQHYFSAINQDDMHNKLKAWRSEIEVEPIELHNLVVSIVTPEFLHELTNPQEPAWPPYSARSSSPPRKPHSSRP